MFFFNVLSMSMFSLSHKAMCSSTKNPYPPHGRLLEIPRARGVLKAKCLEAVNENKRDFPGERGAANKKNLPWGVVWIFSGIICTIACNRTSVVDSKGWSPCLLAESNVKFNVAKYKLQAAKLPAGMVVP